MISEKIEENVIPDYNLTLEHEPSSTAAMLAEVERLYQDKEPFVFPPWCPNPMCGKVSGTFGEKDYPGQFDFRYLEDPKNSQGELDEPAKISSIVNEDLPDDDPVAYAFIKNLRLNDTELVALENEIAKAGDDPVTIDLPHQERFRSLEEREESRTYPRDSRRRGRSHLARGAPGHRDGK